ncbi:MAG: nucleotide exchange factor GrpE [Flavobacteriaceae bacterium]|jgi:molecular chaperone GrpE|nr:nucleotide exchange factor GrpE [Flavobacteriaceae bacterium]MDA7848941.1 nucleotide exchange factor GrpE [Flavobacteriaceae bacterium]MDG1309803.1 nucleotide exchange factor GrpE [Flavobacteriaceae bacterium]
MSKKETKAEVELPEENIANEAVAEPTVELTVEEQLSADLAQEKDKFLRLFAEFENYKRRTTKERIELFSTASQDVIKALLPVLDDFDRALLEMSKSEATELSKGVELIKNKLSSTLEQKGLELVEVKSGEVFNADDHEAITQIPAPTDDMKGKIIDVIEKGYKLGDKVIRFPKVVIGN